MNSECHLVNCPRHHANRQELTQDWFNCQVRIHVLQILIYGFYLQVSDRTPTPKDRNKTIEDRRYWIHQLYETLRPVAHYPGSEASVRLALKVPEATQGLQTVTKWLRDILGNRELPIDRMLLTFLCEGASLLMLCDVNVMDDDLMRAPPLNVYAGRHFFYRLKGTGYAVPELYQRSKAVDHSFISAGILFFQQVVDDRITIEINVLCQFAEFLAGCVILAHLRFNLHSATLPRGWILALLHQVTRREPGFMLLDFLLFEGPEFPALRGLFIHRICRAMALIGYNIPNKNLRDDILKMLDVRRAIKVHECTDRLFKRFTTARSWGGIVSAVQTSCTGSDLDDMVQLCSTGKPSPQEPPPEGIQRVFFKNPEDIPSMLSTGPLRVQAEFEAVILDSLKLQTSAEIEQQIEQTAEVVATDFMDPRDIVDPLPDTAAPLVTDITQEQKDVAFRLLKSYRKRIREQELENSKSASREIYDSYFETCLNMALDTKRMQWPHGFYYRKLYLGLVPHLLTCAKAIELYAQSEKTKTKQGYKEDGKQGYKEDEKLDYDSLKQKMNELVDILKVCKKLALRLDPSSEVHKKRDIEGLKKLVREVEALVNRVPSGAGLDIHFNLQLAIKAIITKPTPKAKSKPKLNMEDDLSY
ncbi:hypothetical protein H1R20_g10208, partial [Candolleomyces eurysporus]